MSINEKREKSVGKRMGLKEQFLLLQENRIVPIMFAVLVLIPLGIAIYAAYKRETDEVAYILAILSLFTSMSFEVYEWYYLLIKKDASKKVLTFPCVIDFILLLIFSIFYTVLDFNVSNKITNIMCAVTLFCYIILVTMRGIKEYKLNHRFDL